MMGLGWQQPIAKKWWYFIFLSIRYREIIMSDQNDPSNKKDQPQFSTDSDDFAENTAGGVKSLLISIGGVILVLAILILLPMFLTYLSEGDYRAPSEIHPTDTGKTYKPGN
jgi:hypothetical protein